MRTLIVVLGMLIAGLATPVLAAETDAARAARWQDLRHAVFGDRALLDGAGMVALEAPARALDAALVPIAVTLAEPKQVKALYLIIDDNPSPLVGTFHFGPAADARIIKTRVRIDQYTLMHAVAETADGRLYVAERFIKAAGGCSAPSSADPKAALKRLGRMKLKLVGHVAPDQADLAQLLISHPNNNGLQMDQLTHYYIPARFIETVRVSYNGATVFDLDSGISLSEDPAITFGFVPHGAGVIKVEVEDSKKTLFRHSFDLAANPS